jgi:hypothetical protein
VEEVENKKAIEAELSELIGKPMSLRFSSEDPSQVVGEPEQDIAMSQVDIRRDARQDENVKLVVDIFNGRVVEVKP